jgi:hypothetical protein
MGVAIALDARTAYVELQRAAEQVRTLQSQVEVGDSDAAAATAAELPYHTGAARDALNGSHWTLLGKVPRLGVNVQAAQTVSVVVDDIATGALGDLMEAVQVVDPATLAPVDGRIDLEPIAQVSSQVVSADETVRAAKEGLDAIEPTRLTPQLQGPIADLAGEVDAIASLTATASRAVQLIPPMMGADGPRDYILLVQNNAEPRATGGIPGAVVHLRAVDGAIELVEQRPASSFGPFVEPVVEIDDVERAMFGTQLGRYMQDVTFTPDFPRSAEIAREMWLREVGGELDGVLSIDPVALQTMLAATGPVTLPTGQQLTSENAAQILLNQVYIDIEDPAAQDDFFALAAATIFGAVTDGAADPAAMVGLLDQAADQGRLLVWSANHAEQRLITGTTLSGDLAGSAGDSPLIGVFLNDRSAAKIGFYQQVVANVTSNTCMPDGTQRLVLAVEVSSAVPSDYTALPGYLTGGGHSVQMGNIRSDLLVYAPAGARISEARSSSAATTYTPRVHDGLQMGTHKFELAPGESITFEYDMELSAATAGAPTVRVTPGPADGRFAASTSACAE